ncbi:Endonuclease/exonuclease/phosphatase [Fusarium solani]|jgi:endonuclease/exonuclease/phosphatase family metal-dependent hydrolase|uniref:Endonuclease/exonuclease/phosphatase n=1 Tax=Fusarium solani TaxID=169388 RepID=A0A9P9GP55_FUSSL|nr:Endonuclease/exonuclease/phosphatase [Fusarium solani]KAH7243169.1 Endonuclease/exonuclease/phosphatase [Fusarium solani]
MKLLWLLVGAAASVAAVPYQRTTNLRLMTYNIRYNVKPSKAEDGEELWPIRRPLMAAQLNYELAGRPDSLVCMQEVTYPQAMDLMDDFGDDWALIGGGRRDGVKKGELSPIFYRRSIWNLEQTKTYWLSRTPDKAGSIGWDAELPRVVTVGRFRHIHTGARVVYMCTHFDWEGKKSQEHAAAMIVDLADRWSSHKRESLPVFIAGDLNATPESPAYSLLATQLYDLKYEVPSNKRFGHQKTYTGFTIDGSDDMELDHMFVRDPMDISFKSFAVLNTRYDDGIFISDHRPVVVDMEITQIARKD